LVNLTDSTLATWGIAALATAGVITRPFRWPEAIWAVGGAIAVVGFGLLPWTDAVAGLRKGLDVYLFLAGMMLLAEVARHEGLFDWLAALATSHAKGSASRLFLADLHRRRDRHDFPVERCHRRRADAGGGGRGEGPPRPGSRCPYLLVCAFIANAASFVLPISNPANLVIYGNHMPPLLQWLPRYLLPSVVSIAATYLALRWTQRRLLARTLAKDVAVPPLSNGGKTAAARYRCDRGCAARGIGHGYPPGTADLSRGYRHRGHRARSKTASDLEHIKRYFLGRAAPGRRPLRPGRGIKSDRRHRHDQALLREPRRLRFRRPGRRGAPASAVAVASNLA
jgi:arsenical pump membrane protein